MIRSKEVLLKLIRDKQKIDEINEKIEELYYRVASTTVKPKEIDVMTSKQDNFGNDIVLIAELKEELAKRLEKYNNDVSMIKECIKKINNEYYREIIILKYFQGISLCKIADKYKKEYASIRKAHGRALAELNKFF